MVVTWLGTAGSGHISYQTPPGLSMHLPAAFGGKSPRPILLKDHGDALAVQTWMVWPVPPFIGSAAFT